MSQITHVRDPETGALRQVVTAEELRRILRRAGDSLSRPTDFTEDDEWCVRPERRAVRS